jgi:PAS domain S-box-containing protein
MDNHELLKSLSFATAIQTVEVYGLVLVTLQGQIVTWNAGAEQLLGYSESEAVGQNFSFFFTPEDRAARVPQQEIAKAATPVMRMTIVGISAKMEPAPTLTEVSAC